MNTRQANARDVFLVVNTSEMACMVCRRKRAMCFVFNGKGQRIGCSLCCASQDNLASKLDDAAKRDAPQT